MIDLFDELSLLEFQYLVNGKMLVWLVVTNTSEMIKGHIVFFSFTMSYHVIQKVIPC